MVLSSIASDEITYQKCKDMTSQANTKYLERSLDLHLCIDGHNIKMKANILASWPQTISRVIMERLKVLEHYPYKL